jgi:hypothetical protein
MQLHAQELAALHRPHARPGAAPLRRLAARHDALNPPMACARPSARSLPKALGIDQAAALLDGNGASKRRAAGLLLTRDAAPELSIPRAAAVGNQSRLARRA